MKNISHDLISTLEEYVFVMGVHATTVEAIYKLQQKCLKENYLHDEEEEFAVIVANDARRLFQSMAALLSIMGVKANINAEEVLNNLLDKHNQNQSTPD